MSADVIVGLQWGDEGKGKIVDLLCSHYDVVGRYQGGHNAGHTIVVGDQTYTFHLLPSGVLNPQAINIIGNGVVVHLSSLIKEIAYFCQASNSTLNNRLLISHKAHIIFDFHQIIDEYNELLREKEKIGTTGKGIGPAYVDKVSRVGFRMEELLDPKQLANKLMQRLINHTTYFDLVGFKIPDAQEVYKELSRYADLLSPYIVDTTAYLYEYAQQNKKILLEGAQGSMLDIDHGTYPFVTSSNTLSAAACIGMGISPKDIGKVIGIAKAYSTRVGNGVFPTEDFGTSGEYIGKAGHEFGTTTGRKRRCGWLDLHLLKKACQMNGVDEMALMKIDALDGLEEIRVAVGYSDQNGRTIDGQSLYDLNSVQPIYKTLAGWQGVAQCKSFDDLPSTTKEYVDFIEQFCGVSITMISTSPKREDIIWRSFDDS